MLRSIRFTGLVLLLTAGLWSQSRAPEFVRGEVLAAPTERLAEAYFHERFAAAGLQLRQTDPLSGLMRVGVPKGQESFWAAALSDWVELRYATRNGIGSGGLVPNDTHFGSQWHLENTGQSGGSPGADIEVVPAWDITTGSSGVVVAVLDSGIDFNHPDFQGRIDPDGFDFVDNDSNPQTDHPHGTWVSGCLMANANNGFGVTGVDWQCRVLPIKVLDRFNRGTVFSLAAGLNYTATQGDVQIVSLSLINYPADPSIASALAACRAAGQIVIACAGNGGVGNADSSWPGASPDTISIGATTRTDARASFSGTGTALDFVAPGASITTARDGTTSDLFDVVDGCSFATPIASGIASLLIAQAWNAGLGTPTQTEIYNLFREGAEDQVGGTSDPLGRDDNFGHGRLNALASLQVLGRLGPCAGGTVGLPLSGPENVLFIDGQASTGLARRVVTGVAEPITISLNVPSSIAMTATPAQFAIWGVYGTPTPAQSFMLPAGLGEMCFIPYDFGPAPHRLTVASSVPLGTELISAPPAPFSLGIPFGFPAPLEITIQGLVLDDPSGTLAITNAVTLEVLQLPPPSVTLIAPVSAATGATVVVTGSNFRPGSTVEIGGIPLAPLNLTGSSFSFVMPAGIGCDAVLTITNPDGSSAAGAINPTPDITQLQTPQGTSIVGGSFILIQGMGFDPATTVTLDGNPVTLLSAGANSLLFRLPAAAMPGTVPMVVTTGSGCSTATSLTYTL